MLIQTIFLKKPNQILTFLKDTQSSILKDGKRIFNDYHYFFWHFFIFIFLQKGAVCWACHRQSKAFLYYFCFCKILKLSLFSQRQQPCCFLLLSKTVVKTNQKEINKRSFKMCSLSAMWWSRRWLSSTGDTWDTWHYK